MAWRRAKHTSSGVKVLAEAHLDVHMVRVKKQDDLVKDRERTALSSTRCFPAVPALADRVHYHLMTQSHAFACALSVSGRLIPESSFESAELPLQRHLRDWHWNFCWQERLA